MTDFVIAFAAMLPAFALGWIVVRLLAVDVSAPIGNRWLEIALGTGLGVAISSSLYFLLLWAGIAGRAAVLTGEVALLAIAIALLVKRRRARTPQPGIAQPSWIWLLRAAALIAVCFFGLNFSAGLAANPQGEYDAAAIWNLRANYLAAGAPAWHYAVSDRAGTDHPGYPLLTSAFIARTWVLLGNSKGPAPAVLALVFTLATFAVLSGGLAALAGETAGWLALLVLLASDGFTSQAATQYADVPLSFFIVAALAILALAESRQWPADLVACAGLFAGFAAWTKNEGLVFAALAVAVAWWRGGARALPWVAAGVAPGLLLTLALKMFLVEGRESMFPKTAPEAAAMIVNPARWMEIVKSFAHSFWSLGFLWAHPILLLAILAWAFGFARDRWWLLVPSLGLLAADFSIYLISTNDLTWHLGTSNNRVIAQVWPAILFASLAMLRAPAVKTQPDKKLTARGVEVRSGKRIRRAKN